MSLNQYLVSGTWELVKEKNSHILMRLRLFNLNGNWTSVTC